jgi:hypothetical protein
VYLCSEEARGSDTKKIRRPGFAVGEKIEKRQIQVSPRIAD